MGKKVLWVLVALLAIVAIVVWTQRWANSVIEEDAIEIAQLKADNAAKDLETARLRAEKEEEIATLRGQIDSSETKISQLMDQIMEKDNAVALRDQRLRELETEVQPIINSNAALREYVDGLKFNLKDKDDIIFSLRGTLTEERKKVDALEKIVLDERAISESWKKQYEREQALRTVLESSLTRYQKSLKTAQARARWIGVGAGILGAVVGSALHK